MTPSSPPAPFSPAPGEDLGRRRLQLDQAAIAAYADASGDHNPIHLDPEYARRAGLPSTIAHGLLTLGVACAAVEEATSATSFVSRVACRFSAPVPSGSQLSCSGRVQTADQSGCLIELSAVTDEGERAITRARVELSRL